MKICVYTNTRMSSSKHYCNDNEQCAVYSRDQKVLRRLSMATSVLHESLEAFVALVAHAAHRHAHLDHRQAHEQQERHDQHNRE